MSDPDPYAEIRALRARLARIEAAASTILPPRIWTTDEIADRPTYEAHRAEIMQAAVEGRIVEAEPEAPVRVEYPPSEIPGWTPVGRDMFEAPAPTKKEEPK
jgi:hypothetical protein